MGSLQVLDSDDDLSSDTASLVPGVAMPELDAQFERLMSRLRLAVIFGGNKHAPKGVLYPSHNTRSWKSYEAVATDIASALRRIGFRYVQIMPEDMRLGDRLRRERIHMAWLNTGGVQGQNPTAHAASMLEMLGVPYVCQDPLAATTLDNKHAFKREAVCAGLPTAPFVTWHCGRGAFRPELNRRFQKAFEGYSGPFIVKPVSGRASLHVHVVDNREDLSDVVHHIYDLTDNTVLIEKFLTGREYCVAVTGPVTAQRGKLTRRRTPFAFGALERVLDPNEQIFTSMDVRPITKDRCRLLDVNEDHQLVNDLHALAAEVFLEFNLRSLIRLDVRADETGKLQILEANPKPDLARPKAGATSLVSEGLTACEMSYEDLIHSLLADRLDTLLAHGSRSGLHISDLLRSANARRAMRAATNRRTPALDNAARDRIELTTELSLNGLNSVLFVRDLKGSRPAAPSNGPDQAKTLDRAR